MRTRNHRWTAIWAGVAASLAVALVIPALAAQRGEGCCGSMMGGGHMADMRLIHQLFANRDRIQRSVTLRSDGLETLTESDDPEVAKVIQAHVASMSARVTDGRPIHQRDPLFREIFRHAADIRFSHEPTPRGVKVVETSSSAYAVKLIQAHAAVLNLFLKNGPSEMMRNHTP